MPTKKKIAITKGEPAGTFKIATLRKVKTFKNPTPPGSPPPDSKSKEPTSEVAVGKPIVSDSEPQASSSATPEEPSPEELERKESVSTGPETPDPVPSETTQPNSEAPITPQDLTPLNTTTSNTTTSNTKSSDTTPSDTTPPATNTTLPIPDSKTPILDTPPPTPSTTSSQTTMAPPSPTTIQAQEKAALEARLESLNSDISKICSLSSTAGLTLGVLHCGSPLLYSSFGHSNLESSTKSSEDRIYHICELSQFFSAYIIGLLVTEGKLKYDDTVIMHLGKEFLHLNQYVQDHLTVKDCLTHKTGLSAQDHVWHAEHGRVDFGAEDTLKCFGDLEPKEKPGLRWRFNNWGYAIIGKLIEKLTGKKWGEVLKERIFDPLGMENTFTDMGRVEVDDTAVPYMTTSNGCSVENGRPEIGDGSVMTGAFGIQSSVHDLLLFYKALFDDFHTDLGDKRGLDLEMLTKKHVDLRIRRTAQLGGREQSYSMGWIRTELPGMPSLDKNDNTVLSYGEKDGEPGLLWHQSGNYPGFSCASYLIPESQTAVVVLTNSTSKTPVADTVAQMVISAIITSPETPDTTDWVAKTQKLRGDHELQWRAMPEILESEKQNVVNPMPLYDYVGKYYDASKNWHMEIWYSAETDDKPAALWMCMQGHKREKAQRYQLQHYYEDYFLWALTEDDCAYRGREMVDKYWFYVLKFVVDEQDFVVKGLTWNSGYGEFQYMKEKYTPPS